MAWPTFLLRELAIKAGPCGAIPRVVRNRRITECKVAYKRCSITQQTTSAQNVSHSTAQTYAYLTHNHAAIYACVTDTDTGLALVRGYPEVSHSYQPRASRLNALYRIHVAVQQTPHTTRLSPCQLGLYLASAPAAMDVKAIFNPVFDLLDGIAGRQDALDKTVVPMREAIELVDYVCRVHKVAKMPP